MRTDVRIDDGELSNWFRITQGLRQGLFNVCTAIQRFFAAPRRVTVVPFGQDEVIMPNLVHLKESVEVPVRR